MKLFTYWLLNTCRCDPLAGDGGGVGRPMSGMAGIVDAKDISPLPGITV